MYDEYGELIMEDDGSFYSPHGPEVLAFIRCECYTCIDNVKIVKYCLTRLFVQCIIESEASTLDLSSENVAELIMTVLGPEPRQRTWPRCAQKG